MDEYLKPNASFLRLLNEYRTYGKLVIAFDLDNTVYDFHKKGETYEQVITLIRELHDADCYLICFTANSDRDFVEAFLQNNHIPYHSINENPPFFKCDERKIYFNALLDDRAGLHQVYTELKLLLKLTKNESNPTD